MEEAAALHQGAGRGVLAPHKVRILLGASN